MANARRVAFNVLVKIEKGDFSNKLLASSVADLDERDVRFATRLVYGVTEKKLTLDYIISKFLKGSLEKTSLNVRIALRMGVYQILFMDSVPDSAACNESVNLIKRKEHKGSVSLTNAVLRNICRQRESLDIVEFKGEKFSSEEERLSVKYSFPSWLIKRWKQQRKDMDVESCLKGMNINDSFWIRANSIVVSCESLKEQLSSLGYHVVKGEGDFLLIENPSGIVEEEIFKQGFFYVQNPSSGLPAIFMKPQEGEKILDMCAAPGGKTTYVADLARDKCEILSCDVSQEKISLIEENIKRLNIKSVSAKIADGTEFNEELVGRFDAVLVDVPCSGTGTIGGKPEIKWRLKETDFEDLTIIQKRILDNASKYVKNGGRIIYSTCSIDKVENTDVVRAFLNEHDDFYVCDRAGKMCNIEEGELQVYPSVDDCIDGFYVIEIRKRD